MFIIRHNLKIDNKFYYAAASIFAAIFFLFYYLYSNQTPHIVPPAFLNGRPLKIVMDNNYPPFIFLDGNKNYQGILVDQWKLFEEKTGVKIEISAMNWNDALDQMQAGGFDIIDTIFFNSERSKIFDYTKPYVKIEVPIFFHKNISGITNAESLHGFAVAVKEGDNAINILMSKGITQLIKFKSYEEIIKAAGEKKTVIFIVDKPPALYFLYKNGIQEEFKTSNPLYEGAFHRAVKKGNTELLNFIEAGFAVISKKEYAEIDEKWYGRSYAADYLILNILKTAALILAALIIILSLWNYLLHRKVRQKTAELMKTLNELKFSEQKYRTLFETMAQGVIYHDLNSVITSLNDSACEILGCAKDELLNKSLSELEFNAIDESGKKIDPDNLPLASCIKTKTSISNRIIGITNKKNQKYIWCSISATPQFLDDEKIPYQFYVTITDITGLKEAQIEREALVSELAAKNKELENMVYITSHDLRAPLVNIQGFSQLLEKNCGKMNEILKSDKSCEQKISDLNVILNNNFSKQLGFIQSSTIKMWALINGILQYSKTNRINMDYKIIDMKNLFESIFSTIAFQIEKTKAVIEIGTLPPCHGDFNQLTQAFANLIDNSLKYNSPERQLILKISGNISNDKVTYVISDNGIGIEPELQPFIWKMFHRLDPNGPVPGDGLGLTLTKQIIEKHKGKIYLKSEKNNGCTFFVELPAALK
ncbi:MAG: transporter substrate-binding domain-containing protein [Candidatus Wallbacteria bacterium]